MDAAFNMSSLSVKTFQYLSRFSFIELVKVSEASSDPTLPLPHLFYLFSTLNSLLTLVEVFFMSVQTSFICS